MMERVRQIREYWPQFKREGIAAVATLVITLMVLVLSDALLEKSRAENVAVEAALQAATATLAEIEAERADLVANLPRYQQLVDRHILGIEHRMAWRNVLEASAAQHGIRKLSYSLAPRAPLDVTASGADSAEGGGIFSRQHASMMLQAQFEREHGFVDLLDDLTEKIDAITIVRLCSIKRPKEEIGSTSLLTASCRIDFVTFSRTEGMQGGGM